MRKLRLLPPDSGLGWTPYAWLVYLTTFLIEPGYRIFYGTGSWWYYTLTALGVALFLVSYFYGHWLRGRRLFHVAAFQVALALLYTPINSGAGVFFPYAGSFAAQVQPPRTGLRALLIIALIGTAAAALSDAPSYYWIVALPITLIVGGVNLHFAQASVAQRKLRLAHEEIEHLATVAERERIARDMHDVLGHTLSLIVLKSELAARLAGTDPDRATAEMRDVEAAARQTLQEVREAIRGYRPGLGEELERARAMLKAARIDAHFDVPPHPLPAAIEETVALVLREAITNIVRHSRATRCTLRLHGSTLEIEDDGDGSFAPEGSGRRGMRERVEAVGGTLELLTGPGTTLRVHLPA